MELVGSSLPLPSLLAILKDVLTRTCSLKTDCVQALAEAQVGPSDLAAVEMMDKQSRKARYMPTVTDCKLCAGAGRGQGGTLRPGGSGAGGEQLARAQPAGHPEGRAGAGTQPHAERQGGRLQGLRAVLRHALPHLQAGLSWAARTLSCSLSPLHLSVRRQSLTLYSPMSDSTWICGWVRMLAVAA